VIDTVTRKLSQSSDDASAGNLPRKETSRKDTPQSKSQMLTEIDNGNTLTQPDRDTQYAKYLRRHEAGGIKHIGVLWVGIGVQGYIILLSARVMLPVGMTSTQCIRDMWSSQALGAADYTAYSTMAAANPHHPFCVARY
jgi:hypothetical protein